MFNLCETTGDRETPNQLASPLRDVPVGIWVHVLINSCPFRTLGVKQKVVYCTDFSCLHLRVFFKERILTEAHAKVHLDGIALTWLGTICALFMTRRSLTYKEDILFFCRRLGGAIHMYGEVPLRTSRTLFRGNTEDSSVEYHSASGKIKTLTLSQKHLSRYKKHYITSTPLEITIQNDINNGFRRNFHSP